MRAAATITRVWLATCALACGCFADAPPIESDTESAVTTDTTDTSDATTANPEACGAGECLAIPAGWLGPFATALVTAGEAMPVCAAPYELPYGVPLHESLVVGELDCGCACDADAGGSACLADVSKFETDGMCSGTPSSTGMGQIPGTCLITGSTSVTSVEYVLQPGSMPVPPTCMPIRGGPGSAGPSGWEREAVLCGLTTPGAACDEGTCIVQFGPDFHALCIVQAGEHDCPGDFADAHLLHVDFTDERQCQSCECDAVAGDCSPVVYVAMDTACDNVDAGTPGCADTTGQGVLATTWQPAVHPSCNPRPILEGDVVPTEPHTVCCRPAG